MDSKNNSENKSENLFNAIAKVATEEAAKQEMAALPSREELKKLYPDGEAFYENMMKKINKHDRAEKMKKARKIFYRFVASVAVVFIISFIGLMSVEASRNFIISRVVRIYGDRAYVTYQFGDLSHFETGQLYFGYLPEGFILESKTPFLYLWNHNFVDENGNFGLFVQYFILEDEGGLYSTIELSPDYEFSTIPFQGHVAYVTESIHEGGINTIAWIYGRHSILAWSPLDMEELIKIAENITVESVEN